MITPANNNLVGSDGKELIPEKEEVVDKDGNFRFNIHLPAPQSGNPNAPLSVAVHNQIAQKNFEQVASAVQVLVNNQKLLGMAVTQHDQQIKELLEKINLVLSLIKEDQDAQNGKSDSTKRVSETKS